MKRIRCAAPCYAPLSWVFCRLRKGHGGMHHWWSSVKNAHPHDVVWPGNYAPAAGGGR